MEYLDLKDIPDRVDVEREDFKSLPARLAAAKDAAGRIYNHSSELYQMISKKLDPYSDVRNYLKKTYECDQRITNASVKLLELMTIFDIKTSKSQGDSPFRHFDNAGFPGGFVIMCNQMREDRPYEWYMSSLRGADALDDTFNLARNYPERIMMSETNDGNVTILANLVDIRNRVGPIVDFYTSDLGFSAETDYNNQEILHAHAHFGQLLLGFMLLAQGGTGIYKLYTTFEMITRLQISLVIASFDRAYLCKPPSSTATNSEVYIIGIGYHGFPREIEKITDTPNSISTIGASASTSTSTVSTDSNKVTIRGGKNKTVDDEDGKITGDMVISHLMNYLENFDPHRIPAGLQSYLKPLKNHTVLSVAKYAIQIYERQLRLLNSIYEIGSRYTTSAGGIATAELCDEEINHRISMIFGNSKNQLNLIWRRRFRPPVQLNNTRLLR
jgi:hypothetical protein